LIKARTKELGMQLRLGPRRWRLLGIFGLLGIFSMTLAGCGKGAGGGEKLIPVTGMVTAGGKPLTTGAVTFHPDTAKGNNTPHIPVGFLDAQGTYKLESGKKEGAPLGWYKVTISAQAPIDEKNPYAPPKHLINPRFADVQTSGLAIQVVENPAPGAFDFKVTK
jgi:hypothetical protein